MLVVVVLLLLRLPLLLLVVLGFRTLLEVVAAIVKGSLRTRKRFSSHVVCRAILHWYGTKKLTPRGVSIQAASVKDWALRTANAGRKLVRSPVLVRLGFAYATAWGPLHQG